MNADALKIARMRSLLNRTEVRRFTLEVCRETARPFTRVAPQFIDDLEAAVRTMIASRVHRAPSRGVTLKL